MTQAKKNTGLGKGLSALLSDNNNLRSGNPTTSTMPGPGNISELPLEAIETNPFQPRTEFDRVALEELAESIRVQGIIQPITVRRLAEGQYQLISGERRYQASKLAGKTSIPAYIRTADDQQMLEMALIENIQREDLNPIEIALSYQRLISEINLKQEELGERVGKDRSTVTNYLRLLRLPPDLQVSLKEKKISMGHARALVNLENVEQQLEAHRLILKNGLSVRKVEELVQSLRAGNTEKTAPIRPGKLPLEYQVVQNKLSSHLGTKVVVKTDKDTDKGTISIAFYSKDDINRILEALAL
jgi:ParB family transcriptional regulator, chromosome partitioning protein